MAKSKRIGEKAFGHYIRGERFRLVDNQWFFAVREGGQHGPFDNESEAKAALRRYIRHQRTLQIIDSYASPPPLV